MPSGIGPVDRLVIHHSASPLTTTFEQVESWHTDPKDLRDGRVKWRRETWTSRQVLPPEMRGRKGNGWDAIAYHHVMLADGSIRVGRALSQRGAHAPPNRGRIGICLIGDNTVEGQGWTIPQITELPRYVEAVQLLFPGILVSGHRDVMPGHTLCPGLDVADILGRTT
jgi:hypothetical protein